MPPLPAADGAGATVNTHSKASGAAAPEPVHRTRAVQGKRERAKEDAVVSTADIEGEIMMERTKLARQLERTSQSLKRKLLHLDNTVTAKEEEYIAGTWSSGNVLRGWDPLVRKQDRNKNTGNGSGSATGAPKHRKPRPTDRIFSLSSSTSQIRKDGVDPKKIADRKKKKKR